MSVTTRKAPVRREVRPAGETRIVIPGMTWDSYATFVRHAAGGLADPRRLRRGGSWS